MKVKTSTVTVSRMNFGGQSENQENCELADFCWKERETTGEQQGELTQLHQLHQHRRPRNFSRLASAAIALSLSSHFFCCFSSSVSLLFSSSVCLFFFLFLSVFLLPPSLVFSYLVLVQFPKESSHPLQPSTLSFLSFFTFHSFILFHSRLACSLEGAVPMHLILFILSTLFQNP